MEGKNTFGCLVNGKAWLPKGDNGRDNLAVGCNSELFDLRAYRINSDADWEYFYLFTKLIGSKRHFELNDTKTGTILFTNNNCTYGRDNNVYRKGTLTFTRFDETNLIFAGTFEITLAKPGCDTIKIRNGRFDMKF
jgi:hypothetical protein